MTEARIYQLLLYGFFVLGALTVPGLVFLTAPYGRHAKEGWGPKVMSRIGWILMEGPATLLIAACFFIAPHPPSPVAWFFLVMWEIHYVNRAFIFPFKMRGGDKPMPLIIAFFGLTFQLINGYLNGRGLTLFGPQYTLAWLYDPRFLVGTAMFFGGLLINQQSDRILINLRKPGETGYKIPTGGFYRWVSCPNYFGEMLEWSGFAVATWSPAGLAFALWTAANLVPRAFSHHKWYRETFPDYPRERRAILPLII